MYADFQEAGGDAVKYAARFLWYVVKKALMIMLVVLLCYLAFTVATDTANTFITLRDGFQARADVVLKKSDTADLSKFFTRSFLDRDPVLRSSDYKDFVIQDYDYKISVEKLWVWSWRNTGEATVVERVPVIKGQLPDYLMTEEQKEAGETVSPPTWESARNVVTLKRENGWWRIDQIQSREVVPDPSPTPTLVPTPTPVKSAAPTVAPTAAP